MSVEKPRETVNKDKAGGSKGNWIRKLGNYSQNERQLGSGPARTNAQAMKTLDIASSDESSGSPVGVNSGSPRTPLQAPDLESIIREFEKGFLSPTKHEDVSNQKNFVKKIVAAFEVKYKTYESSLETTPEGTPKRRSGVFSPAKDRPEEAQRSGKKTGTTGNQEEKSPEEKKRSAISEHLKQFEKRDESPSRSDFPWKKKSAVYVSPYRIFFGEEDFEDFSGDDEDQTKSRNKRSVADASVRDKPEDCRSYKKPGILFSFGRRGSKDNSSETDTCSSLRLHRHDSKDSDCSSLFQFDKEESRKRSNLVFSPACLDDTKTLEDVGLDTTDSELVETVSISGHVVQKTSTTIDEDSRAVPRSDKTPKIVGAFLKKPIEVEHTSIDWIPITGKKLPRKKSLKKLLYSLTGKKLDRKSKLFSSERNLNEEPRELQDSGYDDKSCSSSSLTSLISVAEVLLQQENDHVEPERKSTLKTFGSRNLLDEEEDEAFSDTYSAIRKPNRRQLLLTEVPREELKLDLWPCYPPPRMVTMSLDRRTVAKKARTPSPVVLHKLPKHPLKSKIPKHPFVSTTKLDEPEESHECRGTQEPSIIIKNDLYEVEFRRSCDDICVSGSCRSSSPAMSNYDVPRRFLSKSENEISLIGCSTGIKKENEPIYDVPKPRPIERPRSSVFDEAQALKRRCVQYGSSIYAVPRDLQAKYATIKPRNAYTRNDPISMEDHF